MKISTPSKQNQITDPKLSLFIDLIVQSVESGNQTTIEEIKHKLDGNSGSKKPVKQYIIPSPRVYSVESPRVEYKMLSVTN